MSTLEIESWEDRSGEYDQGRPENAFGFIYFSDGSRVGYSSNDENVMQVWQPNTNGGGEYVQVTKRHLVMAAKLLLDKGIAHG